MDNYIEVSKLIDKAKAQGVDFGKGDPYNRLRYYTKIGWLPNMKRIKDIDGNVKGHYALWVLERLVEIERLKATGATNEEIAKKLDLKNKFSQVSSLFLTPESKKLVFAYTAVIILVLIIFNEIGFITVGKSKNKEFIQSNIETYKAVLDNGGAFVPKNKNTIMIKTPEATLNSNILITFTNDYTPATRYWIEEVYENEGFLLMLDSPVSENAEFNWWITN